MLLLKFAKLAFFRIRITVFFTSSGEIKIFSNCLGLLRFSFCIVYLIIIYASYKLADNFDCSTFFSKLQSIWLQVYKDLLDSFFIWFNHMILFRLWYIFTIVWIFFSIILLRFLLKPYKLSGYFNTFRNSLILLNGNNFVNCSFYVELFNNLDKFSSFQLSKTKDIFNI
jgi:hypothetical protein